MAHLWRQLGGSSWNMIFSKRKLLQDIQHLLVYSTKLSKAVTRLFLFYVYSSIKESL